MTATYDGKLVCNVREKRIDACCRQMDVGVMAGHFYISTKVLALRMDPKGKGVPIQWCPYCGARAEVVL